MSKVQAVAIINFSYGLKLDLEKNHQKMTLSGSSIVVDLQPLEELGNSYFYRVPRSINCHETNFKINAQEIGCNGKATIVGHEKGYILKPYTTNGGVAYFSMNSMVVGEIFINGNIAINKYSVYLDIKNHTVKVVEESIFDGKKGDNLTLSTVSFLYGDLLKALLMRSEMKTSPEKPLYADLGSGRF